MAVFRSWSARILATLALLLIAAPRNERTAAQSAAYALTDLGVIGTVQSAEALGVNDAGQVVGNSGSKAFLWENGVMTALGSLGGTMSVAYAINGAGQIVGQSSTPNNAARHATLWDHGAIVDLLPGVAYSRATAINELREIVGETDTFAFLWQNGKVTDLGHLGGVATYANDINEAGQIVGASYTNEVTPLGPMAHAYVWQNGVMTDLGVLPGLDDSGASAINSSGVIVGSSGHMDPDTYEVTSGSFIYQNGTMTALPVPSSESYAGDINDSGVVVGTMRAPGGASNWHAYVYKDGFVTNLNSLIPSGSDLHLAFARAVNNAGQIVGTAFDSRGHYHAYLLTPVAPGTPLLTIGDASVVEGNSGTTTATFNVTLSPASNQAVTVSYNTANATAASGSDYQSASGTLTFGAGQTTQSISVLVNGDRVGEATETFLVSLSQASGAMIGNGQGIGTIVDDEPRVSIGSVSKNEGRNGTTPFNFTVTLSAASEGPVSVNFATQDYGAHAGEDYDATSGSIAFAAGEITKTITVNVRGDRIVEWEEVFYVNLTGASGAVISNGRGYGTIRNDDK